MKRFVLLMTVLAAGVVTFGVSSATGEEIPLKVTLQPGAECHRVNNAIERTGSLTGLGSQSVNVTVTSGFECMNRGGNNPPGQVSGESGFQPVPRSGNFDFDVPTDPARCPDQMTPIFTGAGNCGVNQAQITVVQQFKNRTETTSFCVPIT